MPGDERGVTESVQIDCEVLHINDSFIPGDLTFIRTAFTPAGKDLFAKTDRVIGPFTEKPVQSEPANEAKEIGNWAWLLFPTLFIVVLVPTSYRYDKRKKE